MKKGLFVDIEDTRVKLSLLWIFAMLNYIYADILTLMDHTVLSELLRGYAGDIPITQGFLLMGAVMMEIPIVMIILSRVLNYRINRIANILAGLFKTFAVGASMFVGTPTMYYLFFGIIEIACTLLIVWIALKWTNPKLEKSK